MIKLFICLVISLFIPLLGSTTPSVSGVSGDIIDSNSITVSGSDFGSTGPTILIFDDFNDGTGDGNNANLAATVGSWDGTGAYNPRYSSVSRSGDYSVELSAFDGSEYIMSQFYKDFDTATEYFLSYGVMVPADTYFPQKYSFSDVGEFPDGSVWKFAWIRDYENDPDAGPDDDDKCLPTHNSQAAFVTDGNDLNNSGGTSSIRIHEITGDYSTWWEWFSWNRMSFWGRADTTNPSTTAGDEWAQGIGEGDSQVVRTDTTHPMFASGTAPYQWTRLHINGWIAPTPSDRPVKLLYDDIYFAVGSNAAARVEIGNNVTYTSCTKLAICTVTAWADTSITVTVREGGFDAGETIYLFVIDSDNGSSVGYLVTEPTISSITAAGVRIN